MQRFGISFSRTTKQASRADGPMLQVKTSMKEAGKNSGTTFKVGGGSDFKREHSSVSYCLRKAAYDSANPSPKIQKVLKQ